MTDGVTPDCKMALPLIQGFHAKKHLADKTHDSDKIVDAAGETKMKGCIPSKRDRTNQREIDEDLYKMSQLVEYAFLKLKRSRSLSTRYCKTTKFGDENELVNTF